MESFIVAKGKANPNMACNRHENACQESWRIHQNTWHFSNNLLSRIVRINRIGYLYNLSDNIIEINGVEGECLIIVDNSRSRIDTPPPVGESAELAITSYLVYLAREGRVEQIQFLLAQYAAESCPIPKSLGDVTRLLADIQKKWLEFCLEKVKLLKDRNIYEVVDLSKRRKVIKNCWIFNIKFDSYYRS